VKLPDTFNSVFVAIDTYVTIVNIERCIIGDLLSEKCVSQLRNGSIPPPLAEECDQADPVMIRETSSSDRRNVAIH